MTQARSAVGNISAEGNYLDGVLHTLSVWEDRKSMSKFMASGAHSKAMKIMGEISLDGAIVYGYESDEIPSWDEAVAIWKAKGIYHGPVRRKKENKHNSLSRTTLTMIAPTAIGFGLINAMRDHASSLRVLCGIATVLFLIRYGIKTILWQR